MQIKKTAKWSGQGAASLSLGMLFEYNINWNKLKSDLISTGDIDEDMIAKFSQVPDDNIDLIIRTGGDKRLSNFLLFQAAYAEIFFVDKLWPDFTRDDFKNCLDAFKKTDRDLSF